MNNNMKWIDAVVEIPEEFLQVYVKIYWRKRIIKQVAFYSTERKEFFTKSGDTFKPKYVQWLKDIDYLKESSKVKQLIKK